MDPAFASQIMDKSGVVDIWAGTADEKQARAPFLGDGVSKSEAGHPWMGINRTRLAAGTGDEVGRGYGDAVLRHRTTSRQLAPLDDGTRTPNSIALLPKQNA